MKIVVGCDHAGYPLKAELVRLLRGWGHQVEDLGADGPDRVDYPDFAHAVARAVAADDEALGLLVCGTGLGMSMAANRHAGVRAALCHDVFSASMTRAHNDANVLCLGARVVGIGLAEAILRAFLSGSFEGGRHSLRVTKIEP